MGAMLRRLRARLTDETGAYPIEFLLSLVAVLVTGLLVIQIFLVFMNATLVNNALSVASQEAAARGQVDFTVDRVFYAHLPGDLQKQCQASGQCLVGASGGVVTPGQESTQSQDVMELKFRYMQNFSLLSIIGLDGAIAMERTLKVASQSAKES